MSKTEKIQRVVIIVLVAIIVVGLSYFGSEVKSLKDNGNGTIYYNSINTDEYKELFELKSTKIVYFGKNDCEYCEQQDPILKELIEEYGIKINYFNLSEQIVTEDDQKYIIDSMKDFLEDGQLRTPTILIIQNKKAVDAVIGTTDKDTLISLFSQYGLISLDTEDVE